MGPQARRGFSPSGIVSASTRVSRPYAVSSLPARSGSSMRRASSSTASSRTGMPAANTRSIVCMSAAFAGLQSVGLKGEARPGAGVAAALPRLRHAPGRTLYFGTSVASDERRALDAVVATRLAQAIRNAKPKLATSARVGTAPSALRPIQRAGSVATLRPRRAAGDIQVRQRFSIKVMCSLSRSA